MSTISLLSKPDAPIAYELLEGDLASNLLVVFLNGLGLPQAAWKPTIDILQQSLQKPSHTSSPHPQPSLLTYDRYGQGASARDPRENSPDKEPGYAHTLDDVVDDLHELLEALPLGKKRKERIVFVNNSIGAHIARRFADRYPWTVQGILFLDSNPGNTDFAATWPNPHAPDFDIDTMLPKGTDREVYEEAYRKMTTIFVEEAKNKEGFDRRGIKEMLPEPSSPKLRAEGEKGLWERGPWVTVVGHEVGTFERQEWEGMGVPLGLAGMYTQPMWEKYNRGLCELTENERAKGPLIAPGSGHFIQKDNPAFVAQELEELIKKVEGELVMPEVMEFQA